MTTTTTRVRVSSIYYDGRKKTEGMLQYLQPRLNLNREHIEELLIEKFGVKIIKSIFVHYNNDPYACDNEEEVDRYVFVDFEWIDNTEQKINDNRQQFLLYKNAMVKHKDQNIRISIQDKNINVLTDSLSSGLRYNSHNTPITQEFMNECFNDTEPFTGGEEEPPLGYRDAYVEFI
jgi:hypothetical protein